MTASFVRAPSLPRRVLLAALVVLLLALAASFGAARAAAATPLDLDNLSGSEAEQMLAAGEITSVELTEAYLERIDALNKSGPGLNAVTQINREAIAEAEKSDAQRALGIDLGPAMGLPILLKDIIDVKGMYTSAGDWALRDSYPEKDSGVAKLLREHGVVILGKAGLSEWANSFGSNPNGFGNLTGQVLNANDTAQDPSGSSSGSGSAGDAALASLTIGTETSGSIISPSTAQSLVGLRPTLGLVPGYGISPILASQDTAGPMTRTVADAAMTLQSIAEVPGTDPESNEEYEDIMGPEFFKNGDIQPAPFSELPDYMSALTTSYRTGEAHRLQRQRMHPAADLHPERQPGSGAASQRSARSGGRDHGPRQENDGGIDPRPAAQLRGPRDDRRLLPSPRLQRAGAQPGRRGRDRRHQPAVG